MVEWYDKKITNASFKELKHFVQWCNKFYGYHPIIVGGWAVYAYTKYQKSRDIDIVLPTYKLVNAIITAYCERNHFRQSGLFQKEFFKEIKTNTGIQKLYLDACSYKNKNWLKENPKIEIPWNLLEKHSREWKLDKTIARIPIPELLVIMKTKAFRDRKLELEKGELDLVRKSFLTSKIKKDQADIQELLKLELNKSQLEKLLQETRFKKYFEETLKELNKNKT